MDRSTCFLVASRRVTRALRAVLCAVLALTAACSESIDPTSDDVLRVALLTPGSVRDAGWNQGAYEGLQLIGRELRAEIAHEETRTPQEFEAGFRDFAARGYDLVFGHGFEFQDAAATVGAEYPKTVFITTSGKTVTDNVAPIVFELEQATYVLGYVGSRLSQSGRLGAIGGMEIPSVSSTFLAFDAGAKAAREEVRVATSYIGGWEDVAAAKEATLAQVSQGADVLIHNADAAGQGFFQALREANVLGFGTNRDQNALAPEVIVASATLEIPRALLLVAEEVQSGVFRPREIRYGLRDDVVGIAWNEALAGKVGDELRAEAEALVAKIEAGELVVPRGF
jgi:basic membrane lipoprotein Med (substrate-binding protein (PBP1-ABC) superfamily)